MVRMKLIFACNTKIKDGTEIAFFNFGQQPKSEMPKQLFIVAENNLFNNRNYF